MQLSTYSDYSVRVLMQTALRHPARVTVDEVAGTFDISRHHLVKVVHDLGRNGYLTTHRGVGGGFTLGRPPAGIRLTVATPVARSLRDLLRQATGSPSCHHFAGRSG